MKLFLPRRSSMSKSLTESRPPPGLIQVVRVKRGCLRFLHGHNSDIESIRELFKRSKDLGKSSSFWFGVSDFL